MSIDWYLGDEELEMGECEGGTELGGRGMVFKQQLDRGRRPKGAHW